MRAFGLVSRARRCVVARGAWCDDGDGMGACVRVTDCVRDVRWF